MNNRKKKGKNGKKRWLRVNIACRKFTRPQWKTGFWQVVIKTLMLHRFRSYRLPVTSSTGFLSSFSNINTNSTVKLTQLLVVMDSLTLILIMKHTKITKKYWFSSHSHRSHCSNALLWSSYQPTNQPTLFLRWLNSEPDPPQRYFQPHSKYLHRKFLWLSPPLVVFPCHRLLLLLLLHHDLTTAEVVSSNQQLSPALGSHFQVKYGRIKKLEHLWGDASNPQELLKKYLIL